ncbi:carotenoid oxygenase family protein [Sorangium sp. So ce118]
MVRRTPAHAQPPWARGLTPLRGEFKLSLDRVEGTLPEDLRGCLYRIGPGRDHVFGAPIGDWIDGDGMVYAFRFHGRHVTFENRFVRTPGFQREQRARARLYPGLGTRHPGGLFLSRLRRGQGAKNVANLNAVMHADRLLALWEGGRPITLDPDTLDTIGEESFGGTLPSWAAFSAHVRRDTLTGDLLSLQLNMGIRIIRPVAQLWSVSPQGRARRGLQVPLQHHFLLHDFGVTATKLIIVAGPYYFEPWRLFKAVMGQGTLLEAYKWNPSEPTRVYVIDRAGRAPVRMFETDPCVMVHTANAYDDGKDVVFDGVVYPDGGALQFTWDFMSGVETNERHGRIVRFRMHGDGKCTQEILADAGSEAPRINPRFDSRPHRYIYSLHAKAGKMASSSVIKVDASTRQTELHTYEDGCFGWEPLFVPRAKGTAEDDGWVLCPVYDSRTHTSFLSVLKANDFTGPELARVHLPFHLPFTVHGSFHAWG